MDVDEWEEVNVMWDEDGMKRGQIAGSPHEVQIFYVNIAPTFQPNTFERLTLLQRASWWHDKMTSVKRQSRV